jgi:hypothetical protein
MIALTLTPTLTLTQVVSMIARVEAGFHGLPPIVTEGIDMEQAGAGEDDPAPADTAGDIEEIKTCKGAIEEASLVNGIAAGVAGFEGTSAKAARCNEMLAMSQGFAEATTGTIEVFMGSWNLEVMGNKLTEICRCVELGSMMKQFAEETKALVLAIVALLQASMEKFGNMEMPALENLTADSAMSAAADIAESVGFDVPDLPSFGW